VYLQIDSGRWLIEHNRERIRREFSPQGGSAMAVIPSRLAPTNVAAGQAKPALAGGDDAAAQAASGGAAGQAAAQEALKAAVIAQGRRQAQAATSAAQGAQPGQEQRP
jgi:conjugal transfer pilus assembly protein TraV